MHDIAVGSIWFVLGVAVVMIALQWLIPYIDTLSFGILNIKSVNSVDYAWQNDTANEDICNNQITQIDYDARRRMREASRKATNLAIKKFPKVREVLLRGRVAISTSICDNHITFDLKHDAAKFIARKVEDCVQEQFRDITLAEHEALVWCTVQWVSAVLMIQQRAIEQKLEVYRKVEKKYKNNVYKQAVAERIAKNQEYLVCITTIIPDDHSGIWRTDMTSQLSGSHVSAITNVTEEEIQRALRDSDVTPI